MDLYNWDRIPVEQLTPEIERQVIHTPSLTLMRARFKAGAMLATHSHVHEQVSTLMQGRVRFILDEQEIMLQAGDVLRIPSDVLHSAEALDETLVLDVFTPARTDWQ